MYIKKEGELGLKLTDYNFVNPISFGLTFNCSVIAYHLNLVSPCHNVLFFGAVTLTNNRGKLQDGR